MIPEKPQYMTREEFQQAIDRHTQTIEQMKQAAHELHDSVNQRYGKNHPYGFHLDMVAEAVSRYGHEACAAEEDVLPLLFGAYFHDSIEDARLTYNDVKRTATRWMDDRQALMAAEIVYALTNDKGRTRAERAGDRYYEGIRQTPYAPMVKLADRLANTSYSFSTDDGTNNQMKKVYAEEMPHFLEAIDAKSSDRRYALPQEMLDALEKLMRDS